MEEKIFLEDYLKSHLFLSETFKLYQTIEAAVKDISPLEFPNVEKCQALTAEKLPLLQHEDLQIYVTEAIEKLAPKVLNACNFEEINETNERLIKWAIIEKLIPHELKLSDVWEKWSENYCPICGRKPVLAQLRKFNEGRARYLKCGGCGTMWHWDRLGCVYCDNKDLKKIHILEIESEPQMRLDVCDDCHCYIKTYNREGSEDIFLNDYLTLHFDLLAEDKNLKKVGSVLLE